MSVRISNNTAGIKVNNVKSETVNSNVSKSQTQHKSWEFFKNIQGIVTDFLNKQINIPSTAFTPNFVLPTKDAFAKISMVIGIFNQLKTRLSMVGEVISGSDNTISSQRKQYVIREINKNLGRW
jgi:hypothetical protein